MAWSPWLTALSWIYRGPLHLAPKYQHRRQPNDQGDARRNLWAIGVGLRRPGCTPGAAFRAATCDPERGDGQQEADALQPKTRAASPCLDSRVTAFLSKDTNVSPPSQAP